MYCEYKAHVLASEDFFGDNISRFCVYMLILHAVEKKRIRIHIS